MIFLHKIVIDAIQHKFLIVYNANLNQEQQHLL